MKQSKRNKRTVETTFVPLAATPAAMARAATIRVPRKADLPRFYYDYARVENRAVFKFLAVDLERMRRTGETPEDIIAPKGECAENDYLKGFLEHAAQYPEQYPWVVDPATRTATVDAFLREYRSLLAYEHAGRRTYYFTSGLTENLCYTKLNIECDRVRLPFPGFAFVFDSPEAIESFGAFARGPLPPNSVITVFVREDTLEEVGFRRLLLVGYLTANGRSVAGISRQLAMKDGWTLEQALRTDWDAPDMRGPSMPSPGAMLLTDDDGNTTTEIGDPTTFFTDGLQFIRLVLNGILYLTSRDADVIERLSGRQITVLAHHPYDGSGRTGAPEDLKYMLVGDSVEPIPLVIDPTKRYDPTTLPQRGKRQLRVQFMVAGFWRRKPNSPADAPKDVWVRPYRKGPDMAELVSRPYVVR